jgi:hypothetical protein
MHVTNAIPLGCSLLLPVGTVISVQTLKVPYAEKFDVEYRDTTLREYYENDVVGRLPHLLPPGDVQASEPYVFKAAPDQCSEGFEMISSFLHRALAIKNNPCSLFCDPVEGEWGLSSMHFFMGNTNSGAPSHVHSDAANLNLHGSKLWKVVPPNVALFSRSVVNAHAAAANGGVGGSNSDGSVVEPMQCVQRAGDMVYVPFDWGHSAR